MVRKVFITLAVFALAGLGVLLAGTAAGGVSPIPNAITEESPCPVTGCVSGACHDYAHVPEPDGIHEMVCPEASCASVDCHAYSSLSGAYRQARDASLNLWILFPMLFFSGLVAFVLYARRPS